jgi:hypothetical protein
VDEVDSAIVGAAKAADTIQMANVAGDFTDTGRPFAVSVPADMSDGELGAIVELLVRLKAKGAQQQPQARKPRVWTPGRPT